MSRPSSRLLLLAVLAVGSIAFAEDPEIGVRLPAPTTGAVIAMTNGFDANEIVLYRRAEDGSLSRVGRYATGGRGSGAVLTRAAIDPLGSQNSLIADRRRGLVFAVNAASNDVSVLRIRNDGLEHVDTVASGGGFPVSLALHGDLLYVLNAGGTGSVVGFRLDGEGRPRSLPGSTRDLELGNRPDPPVRVPSPAQIEFTPDGQQLVLVLKEESEIRVWNVGSDGLLSDSAAVTPSAGLLPFGFGFDRRGRLVVSEAIVSAASSYAIRPDGEAVPLSRSVANGQLDTCWLVTVAGVYAYTTNTSSHNLSGYRLREDGGLELLDEDGVTLQFPSTAAFPTDLAATSRDRYLYTLNVGTGTIGMIRVEPDGSLVSLGEIDGLPPLAGAQGIAAY